MNKPQETDIKISVIIVNYNVKEYLSQALHSIQRALKGISHEIIVVDNASVDGSVPYLKKNFPHIKLIANKENVGFARANNQALELCRGEFVVLINPDTVVQEDTFSKLLEFFEQHSEASAATCKIINPDGTFSIDCRHSIPTPSIAFWKVTGLSKLFPKSRLFGQYNLTYLDPNEIYQVPAISGSFMMIKRAVLEKTGFFDEQFFMYCEDIDLCHRINEQGFKIFYVPTTQIIHYKGESTRKENIDYIVTFSRSLYQFFKKYYEPGSLILFRWLIVVGIFLRGILIFLKNFLRNHFPLLLDVLFLNLFLLFFFFLRYELKSGFTWEHFWHDYSVVNLLSTAIFLVTAFYFDVYPRHRFSIHSIVKTNLVTFVVLASLTFFLKQFAFSRLVVAATFFTAPVSMILWRFLLRKYFRPDRRAIGKDIFSKPTILVGSWQDVEAIYRKLQGRKELDFDLIGWVSVAEEESRQNQFPLPNLGNLRNLGQIIRLNRVREVIFSAQSLSYEQILRSMSQTDSGRVEYRMVPSNLVVIIGKSQIERLDDYPLVNIDYAIGKPFNRVSKRVFDLLGGGLALLALFPFWLFYYLSHAREITEISVPLRGNQFLPLKRFRQDTWLNIWFFLLQVVKGNFSLVGRPIETGNEFPQEEVFWYKPGITGLVQLNRKRILLPEDTEKYHLFYLKNQSLLLDLEILFKALLKWLKREKEQPEKDENSD